MKATKVDAIDAAREILTRFDYRLPLNIKAAIHEHGITIIKREMDRSVTGFLLTDETRVTMVVNGALDAYQQRFSLAHLLGHFVLHGQGAALFVDFRKPTASKLSNQEEWLVREREADEFAAELLMPEDVLRDSLGGKPRRRRNFFTQPVAAHFGVSEIMFALRLTELGINPGGSIYSRQF